MRGPSDMRRPSPVGLAGGIFWIMQAPWKARLEATARPENQAFRETLQGAWAWQKT